MEAWGIARALHVLGVLLWIGGVAMVTTVLLPAVQRMSDRDGMAIFRRLEHRFAAQARWTTQLVGLSGLYMVHHADMWSRFADPAFWWMHAMVLVWALFTVMLFVVEPFVLKRRAAAGASRDPQQRLRAVQRTHWLMLLLSLVTVAGAAAGSHGVHFF